QTSPSFLLQLRIQKVCEAGAGQRHALPRQSSGALLVLRRECEGSVARTNRRCIDHSLRLLEALSDPLLFIGSCDQCRLCLLQSSRSLHHDRQIALCSEQVIPKKMEFAFRAIELHEVSPGVTLRV